MGYPALAHARSEVTGQYDTPTVLPSIDSTAAVPIPFTVRFTGTTDQGLLPDAAPMVGSLHGHVSFGGAARAGNVPLPASVTRSAFFVVSAGPAYLVFKPPRRPVPPPATFGELNVGTTSSVLPLPSSSTSGRRARSRQSKP